MLSDAVNIHQYRLWANKTSITPLVLRIIDCQTLRQNFSRTLYILHQKRSQKTFRMFHQKFTQEKNWRLIKKTGKIRFGIFWGLIERWFLGLERFLIHEFLLELLVLRHVVVLNVRIINETLRQKGAYCKQEVPASCAALSSVTYSPTIY